MGMTFQTFFEKACFYPTSAQEDSDLNEPQLVGGEMNCGKRLFFVVFCWVL